VNTGGVGSIGQGGGPGSGGVETGPGGAGGDAGSTKPDPREDLTGLIPTSGSHIVFQATDGSQSAVGHLFALDLESKQKHELFESGGYVETEVSEDGTSLIYGNPNGITFLNLYLARFTDHGILPGERLTDATTRPGNFRHIGWLSGGRFALFEHRGSLHGIDIYDTWTRKLHWSKAEEPSDGAYARLSENGQWFTYYLQPDGPTFLGQITENGVESQALPATSGAWVFDRSGTVLAYYDAGSAPDQFHVDLQALPGQAVRIGSLAGVDFMGLASISPDRSKVYGYRVFLDGASDIFSLDSGGKLTVLSDPTRNTYWREASLDGKTIQFLYETDTDPSKELVLADALGAQPAVSVATGSILPHQLRRRYYSYELNMSSEYWLARRTDDNALINVRVSEPGERNFFCDTYAFPKSPEDRFAVMDGPTSRIILVDMSTDPPRRVVSYESAQGYKNSCPQWSPRRDSFAYAEYSEQGSRVHMVSWGKGAAPASAVIYEGPEVISNVIVTRPK
jgi:Tol biopolymer transport system component